MTTALQLNDPVSVARDKGSLEGIVVYLGSVQFDTGDDWVGVRLTGPSVGLGKNNGTVQGHAYFDCPPNCGIFVKTSNVEKRSLTRLEALRLKRELATSISSSSVATNTTASCETTPAKKSLVPSTPAKTTTSTTIRTTPPKESNEPSAVKARARLEDIRKRRAALQEKTTEARSEVVTHPPPDLQHEIESLKTQLAEQKSLAQKELQMTQAKYQQQIDQLRRELQQASSLSSTEQVHAELQDQFHSTTQELNACKQELERVQHMREQEQQEALKIQSELSSLKNSLAEHESRNSVSTEHYKERAKLQAEISTLKRKIEQMEKERLDLENALEDLTLDKEQLLEEKEILEDRYEELKIDAETAQIQVDELRMELEDAKQITDRADVDAMGDMDAEDKAQALALQNARFRQALIRLREQSSVEKMELQRRLRDAEKDLATSQAVVSELESLRQLKLRMEDEINELKDMVEQGAAFEGMVEDLSDRVLSLEEDVVQLQSTIRELEEAAELAAEMEEVQADELKAINRDLEGRDTIIRNLEEAIKMQRRREEDMRRTVANYRTTVETLKMEKQTLIDLQQGGEGQQKSLLASSQKALAKAAQLVADAAALRKREAKAVMDKIDHQIYRHLSTRLELLLPQAAVGAEVAAIKGELLTAKVVNKASQSLAAIATSFGGSIRPPIPSERKDEGGSFSLSDEVKAEVATMFHQTEYALDIVNVSSGLIRFLAAGQWPDLLGPEASSELGALLSHSMLDLDLVLGNVLQSMKEEGALIPEQSNIERLRQATKNTMHHLETDIEREDGSLVPTDWNPPGLNLLKEVSLSKFSCMGAAAMLSSAINAEDSTDAASLNELYNKVEQCGAQASAACLRFVNMDVKSETMISNLTELVSCVNRDSSLLLQSMKELILADGDVKACEMSVDSALRSLTQLSAALRTANLNPNEDGSFHPLSPEADDVWDRLSNIVKTVREVDGDSEDINYLLRSRQIEHALTTAVENEPKLANAESKIAILEKNLSSRAKELAMQNARLSELERMLAKSNVAAPRSLVTDFKSSQEYNMLMEENRVLMEAMDVLQRQVDEYENEIRFLKDSARGGGGRKGAPRRALTSISDMASNRSDDVSSNFSLEASLFRPALQEALRESWKWKAIATANAMSELSPLPLPTQPSVLNDDSILLNSALVQSRLHKASVKLIDLTNKEKAPRTQLRELRAASLAASQLLESVALRLRGNLMQP